MTRSGRCFKPDNLKTDRDNEKDKEKNEALHRCLPGYLECGIASRGLSLSRLLASLLRYELRSLRGSPL